MISAAGFGQPARCCARDWTEAWTDTADSGIDAQGVTGVLKDPRSRMSLLIPSCAGRWCSGMPRPTISTTCSMRCSIRPQCRLASRACGLRRFRRVERIADLQRRARSRPRGCAQALLVSHQSRLRASFASPVKRRRAADRRRPKFQYRRNGDGLRQQHRRSVQHRVARRSRPGGAAVQIVDRAWYNPNLETRWFMIPA